MSILEKAKPENYFRCADSSVIGSVYELEDRLCTMSYETFCHHVNPARNDFHNWVRDVFQDYELAGELLKAKTPAVAAAIVRKHLRKELLAKEEIENAITDVSAAKTKPIKVVIKAKPAKITPTKKKRKPKKLQKSKKAAATAKAANKNRKLNNRKNNRKKARRKKNPGSRNNKRGYSKPKKRIKKKVNRWLNWLKIAPEL